MKKSFYIEIARVVCFKYPRVSEKWNNDLFEGFPIPLDVNDEESKQQTTLRLIPKIYEVFPFLKNLKWKCWIEDSNERIGLIYLY
nr:MAG: hypothetical protein [Lokiarchaeota virus Skoll Meg22_1214]